MNGDVSLQFVDLAELDSSIQKLADAADKTAREVLPAQMRLLATDLAFNTRPRGNGQDAKKTGDDSVSKRVKTVYLDVGIAYSVLEHRKKGYGGAFLKMINKGDFAQAGAFYTRYQSGGAVSYTVGKFDGGDLHRKQQFSQNVSRRLIVTNFTAVDRYIREVQRLVGFAKGGFATAARQLGGVRGIPGFATRQNSPGTGSVTGDGKTLTVTMTNDVRYIENALDRHGEEIALMNRKRAIDLLIPRILANKMKSISRSLK